MSRKEESIDFHSPIPDLFFLKKRSLANKLITGKIEETIEKFRPYQQQYNEMMEMPPSKIIGEAISLLEIIADDNILSLINNRIELSPTDVNSTHLANFIESLIPTIDDCVDDPYSSLHDHFSSEELVFFRNVVSRKFAGTKYDATLQIFELLEVLRDVISVPEKMGLEDYSFF